ncbi:MAG: DUF6382 domain-containing protein [Anaerovoracaceae bacterium]|jgi:hypothetical protein
MEINLRDSDYRMQVDAAEIKEYEERVLSSGLCDFALPMYFMHRGERTELCYECSGYRCAADMELTTAKDCFELLEKALLTLKKAGEFLVEQEKITLSRETVYFHSRRRNVRIAFFPGERCCMEKKAAAFVEELADNSGEQARTYLEKLQQLMVRDNLDLTAGINEIGKIRRELHECGIDD